MYVEITVLEICFEKRTKESAFETVKMYFL